MDKIKLLHLTLERKWFDQIFTGEKKIEYRQVTPYWEKRLEGKQFDRVHFRNGYQKDSSWMIVECVKIERKFGRYRIHLGQIMSYFRR